MFPPARKRERETEKRQAPDQMEDLDLPLSNMTFSYAAR